jgi:glycosyltransferase involved in cell wall biosynthesis
LAVSNEQVASRIAFYEHLKGNVNASAGVSTPAPASEKKKIKKNKLKKKLAKALRFLPDLMRNPAKTTRVIPNEAGHSNTSSHLTKVLTPPSMIFGDGDVYLSVGADWDDNDLRQLNECKSAVRLKVVGMCYDTIPIKFPHLTRQETAKSFPQYLRDLARVCDHVMCISACTERDFRDFVRSKGMPIPPTSIVLLGSNSVRADGRGPAAPYSNEGRLTPSIPAEVSAVVADAAKAPYLLFVSTIERRKNHESLYKVWVRLIGADYDVPNLVCVGMRGWGVNDFLTDVSGDPRIKDRIRLLHNVSDIELAFLYRACLFTVYPSLYEGWGLPVVESLAFGKFCLCSNAGSLPEAGGNFVEYLDPWDIVAWADRVRYFTEHPEQLEMRNRRIEMLFKPHSWQSTSQSILEMAKELTSVDSVKDDNAPV